MDSDKRKRKGKRPIVITMVTLVVLAGTSMILWFSTREPQHKGKPLSFWLDQLQMIEVIPDPKQPDSWGGSTLGYPFQYNELPDEEFKTIIKRGNDAARALADLDTNALPAIIARLDQRDSKLHATIRNWRYDLERFGWKYRPTKLTAYEERGQALTALQILNDRANSAVPALIELTKSDDPYVRASAWYALDQILYKEYRRVKAERATSKPAIK